MKKRSLIGAVLLIAALLAVTAPVAASAPSDVSITALMYPNPEDPNGPMYGTFVASGPAVEAGLLCSAGTVQDIENPANAWQSNQVIVLNVHKHFACSDESGAFEMHMRVLLGPNGTVARWLITESDGAYAGLLGTGSLTASRWRTAFTRTSTPDRSISSESGRIGRQIQDKQGSASRKARRTSFSSVLDTTLTAAWRSPGKPVYWRLLSEDLQQRGQRIQHQDVSASIICGMGQQPGAIGHERQANRPLLICPTLAMRELRSTFSLC